MDHVCDPLHLFVSVTLVAGERENVCRPLIFVRFGCTVPDHVGPVGWNKDFFFRQGFSQCNSVFMIIRIGEGSVRCHAGKRLIGGEQFFQKSVIFIPFLTDLFVVDGF